jgi:putative transposase
VFIDETWTKTNMAPVRGWGPVGERLPAQAPHGHWHTMTLLAALRLDGIEAPMSLPGPINAQRFQIYVKQVLAPTLKPGDVVVMDNLSSHKGRAVRQAIRARGAKLLFLPKYSPDLNPIEQVFSKLKRHLRDACARTRETVENAIAHVLDTITPHECENYFKACGYDPY